jgi:hypothetical protein
MVDLSIYNGKKGSNEFGRCTSSKTNFVKNRLYFLIHKIGMRLNCSQNTLEEPLWLKLEREREEGHLFNVVGGTIAFKVVAETDINLFCHNFEWQERTKCIT